MTRSGYFDALRGSALPLLLSLTACAAGAPSATNTTDTRLPRARLIGPTPWKPYEQWQVERAEGPSLDVFVARQEGRRPLVIFCQGSHAVPVFMIVERNGTRREKTSFLFHESVNHELSRVHFAVVERRGIKSFGPPPIGEADLQPTEERGGVSKAERVRDVADVVRSLSGQSWVDSIILMGHSEGADVVAGVSAGSERQRIRAVGLLSGAGPTQFFDFILQERKHGNMNSVKQVFDDIIWLAGEAPSGKYRGASVRRQITYAIDSTPLDDLRGCDVPVFVAHGTEDTKVPIESADLVVAELLRNRHRLVSYLMLPGLDHGYSASDGKGYSRQILRAFLDWALDGNKRRSVVVGLPSE